jgi:hypothetical protein
MISTKRLTPPLKYPGGKEKRRMTEYLWCNY